MQSPTGLGDNLTLSPEAVSSSGHFVLHGIANLAKPVHGIHRGRVPPGFWVKGFRDWGLGFRIWGVNSVNVLGSWEKGAGNVTYVVFCIV